MRGAMNRWFCRLIAGMAVLGILGGCAAVKPIPDDPPDRRRWTSSEVSTQFGDADPWEGFNRSMFAVNRFGMLYVVRPIGWIWGGIFPRVVIECIDNAAENLSFPARTISCLLQQHWSDGGVEFLRFLTNSTIGIAGLFDPAENYFGLYARKETFGQAFESWGCGPGYTLVLPFSSATNVRDNIGAVFDIALDIKTYLPYGASTAAGVNRAVRGYRTYSRMDKANADPYQLFKEYSLLNRRLQQQDWEVKMKQAAAEAKKQASAATGEKPATVPADPPVRRPAGIKGRLVLLNRYRPENPYSDSVRATMFKPQTDESSIWTHLSPWNGDFTSEAELRDLAAFRAGADDMEYAFWRSPDEAKKASAPLVFLLPGIGSHYLNSSAVAMAEVLYRQGYAVIVLPSVFHWTYYESIHTGTLPGYTPEDAASLRHAMARILEDLAADEDDPFRPESVELVGFSLGGLHALHIAAQEEKENTLNLKRCVAVNPPVDLLYAMDRIDECADDMKGWPEEKVENTLVDAFGKAMAAMGRQQPWRDPVPAPERFELPELEVDDQYDYRTFLTREESRILVSMSFRFTLRDVLMTACRDDRIPKEMKPLYGWGDRTRFYLEIDRLSYRDYLMRYMLPLYGSKLGVDNPLEELGHRAGLRFIESTLRNNDKVRVLHTIDDFLVSDEDRRFLDSALGDRIVWFSNGSHLGHLYYGQVHQILLEQLR